MVKRRKVLLGMGSLAAGGAAAMGTGAFSSVQANREMVVEVADDSSAFLQMSAPDSLENGEYADSPNGNTAPDDQLSITFNGDATTAGGSGVNLDAMNRFDDVFQVTNMGSQEVDIFIDDNELTEDQRDRLRFYYQKNNSRKTLENGNPDDAADGKKKVTLSLGQGNSESIGVEIDTYGLDSAQTLVDSEITIFATD